MTEHVARHAMVWTGLINVRYECLSPLKCIIHVENYFAFLQEFKNPTNNPPPPQLKENYPVADGLLKCRFGLAKSFELDISEVT